ncbi:MAG TPA: Tad domain-containing protein, partial [Jatrophihabitantaceae bacterium]|nr:Tad domain-containing protein [Jatrophihabitantaceae bacterium]
GLMRRVRGSGSERGAVAALVAIMLASGVLLGSGAIVIDVGQAYGERAQLQNGADSASLAVARGCARGASYCDPATTATSIAGKHANDNARDLKSTVTVLCGRDKSGKLNPSCPTPSPLKRLSCSDAPPATAQYAEVHTRTRTSSGSAILPPAFGRAVLGSTYPGMTVNACARAAWGPPAKGNGLALTISYCEWLSYIQGQGGTATNPVYAAPPPAVPPTSAEIVIYFHDTNPNPTHCIAGPSGFDVPGDFGSTDTDASASCTTNFNFDLANGTTTYISKSGSSLSQQCKDALLASAQTHLVTFIPIYDAVTGTGGNGTYTLWSMAAFVVTGFYWPDWKQQSWLTGNYPCGGNGRCISGYFTTGLTSGGSIGGGTGAGAAVVQLVD